MRAQLADLVRLRAGHEQRALGQREGRDGPPGQVRPNAGLASSPTPGRAPWSAPSAASCTCLTSAAPALPGCEDAVVHVATWHPRESGPTVLRLGAHPRSPRLAGHPQVPTGAQPWALTTAAAPPQGCCAPPSMTSASGPAHTKKAEWETPACLSHKRSKPTAAKSRFPPASPRKKDLGSRGGTGGPDRQVTTNFTLRHKDVALADTCEGAFYGN